MGQEKIHESAQEGLFIAEKEGAIADVMLALQDVKTGMESLESQSLPFGREHLEYFKQNFSLKLYPSGRGAGGYAVEDRHTMQPKDLQYDIVELPKPKKLGSYEQHTVTHGIRITSEVNQLGMKKGDVIAIIPHAGSGYESPDDFYTNAVKTSNFEFWNIEENQELSSRYHSVYMEPKFYSKAELTNILENYDIHFSNVWGSTEGKSQTPVDNILHQYPGIMFGGATPPMKDKGRDKTFSLIASTGAYQVTGDYFSSYSKQGANGNPVSTITFTLKPEGTPIPGIEQGSGPRKTTTPEPPKAELEPEKESVWSGAGFDKARAAAKKYSKMNEEIPPMNQAEVEAEMTDIMADFSGEFTLSKAALSKNKDYANDIEKKLQGYEKRIIAIKQTLATAKNITQSSRVALQDRIAKTEAFFNNSMVKRFNQFTPKGREYQRVQ